MKNQGNRDNVTSLAQWIQNVPKGAERLVVVERRREGETLIAYECSELLDDKNSVEIAHTIIETSAQWAESENHECSFLAQFITGDGQPLASYKWRIGSLDGGPFRWPIDGSPEGMLAQNQTHQHAIMRLWVDGFNDLQKGYRQLIQYQQDRIDRLEGVRVNVEKREAEVREHEALAIGETMEEQKLLQLLGLFERILTGIGKLPSSAGASSSGADGSVAPSVSGVEAATEAAGDPFPSGAK